MEPLHLAKTVQRRYALGRQGLWPGRHWAAKAGTVQAIQALGAVQVDPISVVARSHDLVLWSRVQDYQPADLDTLLYQDRAFFDYGGAVHIRPMAELPYWRLVMQRKGQEQRWATFAAEQGALLDEVRAAVRARGPLGQRDFAGRPRIANYRARSAAGLALYYLWLTGELMTHSRQGFDRLYHLREAVAPAALDYAASEADAEDFFAGKVAATLGLSTAREWRRRFAGLIGRPVSPEEADRRLAALLAAGEVGTARVEGRKDLCYFPAADTALLATLDAGSVPAAWQPLDTTTTDEANFLAPLDPILDRGPIQALFDFEYLWEVYKPEAKRRWGYYTLPILYGDTLVARLDPKLERATGTLLIKGFWLEAGAPADDPAFAAALARGLLRFARFHAARRCAVAALHPDPLREYVQEVLDTQLAPG